jgi:transposase
VPHAERDDLYAVVRDQQAVTAGLALPCSSAATMEGNVNMITMIKRQIYGRAAFPSCAGA